MTDYLIIELGTHFMALAMTPARLGVRTQVGHSSESRVQSSGLRQDGPESQVQSSGLGGFPANVSHHLPISDGSLPVMRSDFVVERGRGPKEFS